MFCWGDNGYGQLGHGNQDKVDHNVVVSVPGLTRVKEVESGADFNCARKTNGSVVCWGNKRNGELGDGTSTSRFKPTAVIR